MRRVHPETDDDAPDSDRRCQPHTPSKLSCSHMAAVRLLIRTCGWKICPTRTSSSSFLSDGSDRRANTSHSTRTSPNASRFGGAWTSGGGHRVGGHTEAGPAGWLIYIL